MVVELVPHYRDMFRNEKHFASVQAKEVIKEADADNVCPQAPSLKTTSLLLHGNKGRNPDSATHLLTRLFSFLIFLFHRTRG